MRTVAPTAPTAPTARIAHTVPPPVVAVPPSGPDRASTTASGTVFAGVPAPPPAPPPGRLPSRPPAAPPPVRTAIPVKAVNDRVPSPRPPREATAPPVADRVPAVLRQLAAERATGALLRDRGTLYLVEGRVVGAESPAAPAPEHLFSDGDAPGRGEMEICRLAALFDAAYFALDAAGGPARFHPGVTVPDPSRAVRPIGIETVARETRRRRRLLHGLWPCPEVDVAPVVPIAVDDLPEGSAAAVTPRRRAVLDLADGIRTPADIARELGRLAFHTLVDVRRLAAAGHVETPRAAPLAPPVAQPGPVGGAPRAVTPFAAGPGPHSGGPAPAGLGTTAGIAGITAGSGSGEADIALLRRLRDALEAHL